MSLPGKIVEYVMDALSTYQRRLKNSLNELEESRSAKAAGKQFEDLSGIRSPYFVVAIPGCLHLLERCLKYIPEDVNLVLILNGLEGWEKEWVIKNLKVAKIIAIEKMLKHGVILDLILDHITDAFGILDYDCYVFDPSYFSRLRALNNQTMICALYASEDPKLQVAYPQTFIMYINTPVVNALRRKYKVSVNLREHSQLSGQAKKKLAAIGIDEKTFPEEFLGKKYFDTFRALISLGVADGLGVHFLEKFDFSSSMGKVFHVGSVSNPTILKNRWQRRGAYFWRLLLESNQDEQLQQHYYKKFGSTSASDLLKQYPIYTEETGPEWFDFVHQFIRRETLD